MTIGAEDIGGEEADTLESGQIKLEFGFAILNIFFHHSQVSELQFLHL